MPFEAELLEVLTAQRVLLEQQGQALLVIGTVLDEQRQLLADRPAGHQRTAPDDGDRTGSPEQRHVLEYYDELRTRLAHDAAPEVLARVVDREGQPVLLVEGHALRGATAVWLGDVRIDIDEDDATDWTELLDDLVGRGVTFPTHVVVRRGERTTGRTVLYGP